MQSYLTIGAEFPFVSAHTIAFAVNAMAVTIAVRYFAFVMTQTALFALPARIALTFTVDIFTALAAQHRAYT